MNLAGAAAFRLGLAPVSAGRGSVGLCSTALRTFVSNAMSSSDLEPLFVLWSNGRCRGTEGSRICLFDNRYWFSSWSIAMGFPCSSEKVRCCAGEDIACISTGVDVCTGLGVSKPRCAGADCSCDSLPITVSSGAGGMVGGGRLSSGRRGLFTTSEPLIEE